MHILNIFRHHLSCLPICSEKTAHIIYYHVSKKIVLVSHLIAKSRWYKKNIAIRLLIVIFFKSNEYCRDMINDMTRYSDLCGRSTLVAFCCISVSFVSEFMMSLVSWIPSFIFQIASINHCLLRISELSARWQRQEALLMHYFKIAAKKNSFSPTNINSYWIWSNIPHYS